MLSKQWTCRPCCIMFAAHCLCPHHVSAPPCSQHGLWHTSVGSFTVLRSFLFNINLHSGASFESACSSSITHMVRSQSLNRLVKPTVGYVKTLLPSAKIWLRRRQRLLTGPEKMALQGLTLSFYNPDGWTNRQLGDLAGSVARHVGGKNKLYFWISPNKMLELGLGAPCHSHAHPMTQPIRPHAFTSTIRVPISPDYQCRFLILSLNIELAEYSVVMRMQQTENTYVHC